MENTNTNSPNIPFFPISNTPSPPLSPTLSSHSPRSSPPLHRPTSFISRNPLPAIQPHHNNQNNNNNQNNDIEQLPVAQTQEQNLTTVSQEFQTQQNKYLDEQQQREQQYAETQHTRRQRKNTLQLTATRNKITPGENNMLKVSTGSHSEDERPHSSSGSPTHSPTHSRYSPTTSPTHSPGEWGNLPRLSPTNSVIPKPPLLEEQRPPREPRRNSFTSLEKPRSRSLTQQQIENKERTGERPLTPRGMMTNHSSSLSNSGESKKGSNSSLDKLLGGKKRIVESFKKSFSTPERREQWAWCMYDFGKSSFESVLSVFIGPWITYLAQQQSCLTNSNDCFWCDEAQACLKDIPPNHSNSSLYDNYCYVDSCFVTKEACCTDGGQYVNMAGTLIAYAAFFSFVTSASVIFQVILLPFLGAIGDIYNPKKFWIGGTVISASALVAVLATNRADLYWVAGLLYIIANVCFGTANIFYNASLIYVSTPEERDTISSRGFAIGYSGSVIFLGICLAIFITNPGISTVSLLVALTGVWWFCWAMIPFIFVTSKTPRSSNVTPVAMSRHEEKLATSVIFNATYKLAASFKVLSKQAPQTALFLIAAAIYNDGIMTIGGMAAVYATETVNAGTMELMIVLLILNIMAAVGALGFNQLAKKIKSTKIAIFIGIMLYWVIVIYAYFLQEVWEVWLLGAIMGIAMGSTQSLSRSFLAVIIPKGYESEIFSFYEVTQQGTSWIGPLVYGAFTSVYKNNQRPAMLSMLIFLVTGGIVLLFVNVEKAKEQAAKCSPPTNNPEEGDTTIGETALESYRVEKIDVELEKSHS